MPRDVNGVYTLPPGNPVIPNTIIATNWANTTMDDIAAALTASLSIDGSVTTAKIANSAVTTIKIADGNVTRAKLSTDLQNDIIGQNWIINPHMEVWQAGTSLAPGSGSRYLCDGFVISSTGINSSWNQVAWPVGQTNVNPEAKFYSQILSPSGGVGATDLSLMGQKIEGVRTCAGQQVTVSFWAMCNAARPVAIELVQFFGTGGAPSAFVSTFLGQASLTSTWTRFAFTVNLPNINGKTIGSDNNDVLQLNMWFSAGSSFNSRTGSLGIQGGATYATWGWKVEQGGAATPFTIPDAATNLDLCWRQYQQIPIGASGIGQILYSGSTTSGGIYQCVARLPVRMRAIPNVTPFDGGTGSGFPATDPTIASVTVDGFRAFKTANVTQNASFFSASYTADARL